jgi:hypothetical protein
LTWATATKTQEKRSGTNEVEEMEYRTLLSSKEGSSEKVNKIKILKKIKGNHKGAIFYSHKFTRALNYRKK